MRDNNNNKLVPMHPKSHQEHKKTSLDKYDDSRRKEHTSSVYKEFSKAFGQPKKYHVSAKVKIPKFAMMDKKNHLEGALKKAKGK